MFARLCARLCFCNALYLEMVWTMKCEIKFALNLSIRTCMQLVNNLHKLQMKALTERPYIINKKLIKLMRRQL